MTVDLPRAQGLFYKGKPEDLWIMQDQLLARIYRHDQGHGWNDWNPTRHGTTSKDKDVGGRFDSTPILPLNHGYLYAAFGDMDGLTAVYETLVPMANWNKKEGAHVLPLSVTNCRSLTFFRVKTPVLLADLTVDSGRKRFAAPPALCTSIRRDRTRDWGHRIRLHSKAGGLGYNSSQLGSEFGLPSFVLFEENNVGLTFDVISTVSLGTTKGMRLIKPILSSANVVSRP